MDQPGFHLSYHIMSYLTITVLSCTAYNVVVKKLMIADFLNHTLQRIWSC
jgi:hypothetical protein